MHSDDRFAAGIEGLALTLHLGGPDPRRDLARWLAPEGAPAKAAMRMAPQLGICLPGLRHARRAAPGPLMPRRRRPG
ncbi:hypothetical protein [Mangrovicoccus ximenensis]|uniref:hypothetical protein n=1 Tax=Mangrovicoccus ximenensis TaxID=1911570 RepID=UPI001F2475B3|nr:hypothetical protein [Mangrovicoccus ximenensis]